MKNKNTILKLSASRVKTYRQCPRKYYYTYIEKLPRKHWDHFDLGTLVHGTLEFFHENYRNDEQERPNIRRLMTECFKKQREKMIKDGENVSSEIKKEAKGLLGGYIKYIEENGIGSNIVYLEKEFELKLNDQYKIQGYIDRIDKDKDGVLHIKDYKTNKKIKYMEPFQLQVYGIPLLDLYPDANYFKGSYIMMRFEGTHITYEFTREDVEKAKNKLIEEGDKITKEERWRAVPSILCDWCDFKDPCHNTW